MMKLYSVFPLAIVLMMVSACNTHTAEVGAQTQTLESATKPLSPISIKMTDEGQSLVIESKLGKTVLLAKDFKAQMMLPVDNFLNRMVGPNKVRPMEWTKEVTAVKFVAATSNVQTREIAFALQGATDNGFSYDLVYLSNEKNILKKEMKRLPLKGMSWWGGDDHGNFLDVTKLFLDGRHLEVDTKSSDGCHLRHSYDERKDLNKVYYFADNNKATPETGTYKCWTSRRIDVFKVAEFVDESQPATSGH